MSICLFISLAVVYVPDSTGGASKGVPMPPLQESVPGCRGEDSTWVGGSKVNCLIDRQRRLTGTQHSATLSPHKSFAKIIFIASILRPVE